MLKLVFLIFSFFSIISKAEIVDNAGLLTQEQNEQVEAYINKIATNHQGSRILINTFNSFSMENVSHSNVACHLFQVNHLKNIDVMYVVLKDLKKSYICAGDFSKLYIDYNIISEIKNRNILLYQENKKFEAIMNTLSVIEREYIKGKKSQENSSGIDSFFGILIFVLFLILVFSLISETKNHKKNNLENYYNKPYYQENPPRSRALTKENFDDYKVDLVRILVKEFPDLTLHDSYKKVLKEYLQNIKNNNVTKSDGYYERTKSGFDSFVPYYFLMFNSAFIPFVLKESFSNQKNIHIKSKTSDSSSSGCGTIVTGSGCSSTSSDSGCSGCGGCGGD